jgi:hypothetical protein
MGHNLGGGLYCDRPLEEVERLLNDDLGPIRVSRKLRPTGKNIISTDMLHADPEDPKRFQLKPRFKRFFENRGKREKRDVQSEIDRIKREIAELEGEVS